MGVDFPIVVYPERDRILKYVSAFYGFSSQNDVSCHISYAHGILVWEPSFGIDSGGTVSFGGVSFQREVFHTDARTLYHH